MRKKKLRLIKIFHKKLGWSVTLRNPEYSGRQLTKGEKQNNLINALKKIKINLRHSYH